MKKGFSIRVLTLLLAALLLAPTLMACNDAEDPNAVTTNAGENGDPDNSGGNNSGNNNGDPITPEVPKNDFGIPIIDPGLPENDYDGRDFVVHTRGNVQQYEWYAEKVTGEELNDAIFERNEQIMEKYNVNISVMAEGTWADYASKTLVSVKTNIKANSGSYDLIAGYSVPIAPMVTTGLLYDLNELEYIDFDQPWWSSNFAEEITIADKTFFGVGSLSLSMIYSMYCLTFNKDLLGMIKEDDGSAIDIYNVVLDGKWTWDKMIEYADKVYLDDGDGVVEKTDRYGLAILAGSYNPIESMLVAADVNMVSQLDDGSIVVDVDSSYADKVLGEIIDIMYNTQSVYGGTTDANDFVSGSFLFYHCWLYSIQTQISKLMSNYGILPMPKFSEDQEYRTGVQQGMHMYCIPVDVKDAEMASIVTEALACESYHELVPKYLQICLKSRYSPEEADAKCIDILYNNVSFDIARTFDDSISVMRSMVNMVNAKTASFGRLFTAQQAIFQGKIDKLVNGVENPVA